MKDLQQERLDWAASEAAQEAKDKASRKVRRVIFWVGLAPFLLFAVLSYGGTEYFKGYADGWKAAHGARR